jgi:hypothetical protein
MSRRPSIRLISGNHFFFDDPLGSIFTVEDIAHNLGKEARFNGATVGDLAYTVAQHAVNVSYIVPPEFAFEALHHDDAEAFYKDITTWLKGMMPDYQRELKLGELAVARKFGLPEEMSPEVKTGDYQLLKLEKEALFPRFDGVDEGFYHLTGVELPPVPHPLIDVEPWEPGVAKFMYLQRHKELTNA